MAAVEGTGHASAFSETRAAGGGPALLFTNVKGADFPLVTNLFGTPRRAELAFGQRPLAFIKRLVHLAETMLPPTPAKLWDARDVALAAAKIGTKQRREGPVTDVVTRDVRLDRHTPEWDAWRWAKLEETPDLIVPFKRPVYLEVAERFRRWTEPVLPGRVPQG